MAETNMPDPSDAVPLAAAVDVPVPGAVPVTPSAGAAGVSTRAARMVTQPRLVSEAPHRGGLHRIFGFLGWILTGFGLTSMFRKRSVEFPDQEVTIYCVHRAFFLWPLVLTGFIGAFAVGHWPQSSTLMGWIYIWVLTYTFVSVLFDISSPKFLLWVGIFVFVFVLSRYVEFLQKIQILSHLFGYMHRLQPKLDHGFAVMMSWLLLFPWVGSLFNTFSNGRLRFTPNEISEWHLGDGTELIDRSGLHFRTRYRDLFETVLGFGAGDLLMIDGTGVVRKRWENILFLAFIWRQLDAILHQRAALVDNAADEPVEVEAVRGVKHVHERR